MLEISFDAAIEAINNGSASYGGTTHTEHFGYCAIITRHDLQTTQHVVDVSKDQIDQLDALAGVADDA